MKSIRERIGKNNGDEGVIEELRHSAKPILIYGCAQHAVTVLHYLIKHDLQVEAFVVDSQYYRENFYIEQMKVRDIADYIKNSNQYNIVIGFCNVDKSKFLISNAALLKCNFYFLWEPFKTYEWNEEYLNENWDALQEVYDDLSDELSRNTLDGLISAKLSTNGNKLLNLADDKQYFNELTFCADSKDEVFVDCGAFNGDTILKYHAFTNGKYRKIYAFEPNFENVINLKENVKYFSSIEIINKGTWKEESVLEFEENGSASQIVEKGTVKIPVTTIDKTTGGERVTFIKMDVEGSELESLEGARNTIACYMPKLAICCYHKREDIINLYQYIKKFDNDLKKYQFYLRHHSNNACETVLYAIPVSIT